MNLLRPSFASQVVDIRSLFGRVSAVALLLSLAACADPAANPVGEDGKWTPPPGIEPTGEEEPIYPPPSDGNGYVPPPSTDDYPTTPEYPAEEEEEDMAGPAGGDIGSILCSLFGCDDAGTPPPATGSGDIGSSDPNDTIVPGREPDASNIPECPKHAPENPIGSCIGVPIYATCGYSGYNCICDWYHWICL